MNWLNKLERKIGRYAVPNLIIWLIGAYTIGFVFRNVSPGILNYLTLSPYHILHGQIWRLVTWVFMPTDSNLIFLLIMALFYYQLGMALERTWGTFRFNVYIFGGMIFTVIGAFVLYGIYYAMNASVISQMPALAAQLSYSIASGFSTNYINMSIFLAFAIMYPDMQVMLYFIIPIKMKWMAIVYAALVVYDIVRYFMGGAWFMALPIIASLLNFIIFFLGTRNLNRYNPKEIHRRNQFKRAMGESKTVPFPGGSKSGEVTKHKCAVCGRTEKDDPNLEFRFCSKCNGNYEYCQDHLYTHIHKK